MSETDIRKKTAENRQESPETSKYILLSILLAINVVFLLFIVSRFPEDRTQSLEEVKAQISDKRNGYEIEMHLSRYILLKMQIQKDIREGTDSASIRGDIEKAITELESILSIPELTTALDMSKQEDLRNELTDMKRSRDSFSEKAD